MYTNYNGLVDFIRENGSKVGPRGKLTTEVIGATITVPGDLFIFRSGANRRMIAMETFMLLGGFFDLDAFSYVCPAKAVEMLSKQSDYGPRVMQKGNFDRAVVELLKDEATRRSIIYFNNRNQPHDDIACTTSIQFFVRDNTISAVVNMRSWDVVFGLPADLFMFANLLQLMSRRSRGYHIGDIIVQVGSLHLYESTEELAFQKDLATFETNYFYRYTDDPDFFVKAVDELKTLKSSPLDFWNFKSQDGDYYPIHIGGI